VVPLKELISKRHDSHEVTTATNLHLSFTFEFFVTLVFWNKLLQVINVTSQLLQKKETDLFQVIEFMERTKMKILEYRTDESFTTILQEAQQLWEACEMDPQKNKFQTRRLRAKKRMPSKCMYFLIRIKMQIYFRTRFADWNK
jgi:hypothetical protein